MSSLLVLFIIEQGDIGFIARNGGAERISAQVLTGISDQWPEGTVQSPKPGAYLQR